MMATASASVASAARAQPSRSSRKQGRRAIRVYATSDDDSKVETKEKFTNAGAFKALDTLGAERVESVIGVEPSGDPFNSIRLNADNHPFNAMVNAGAIACSGLLHADKGDGAFDYIRHALGRFAGRELDVQ